MLNDTSRLLQVVKEKIIGPNGGGLRELYEIWHGQRDDYGDVERRVGVLLNQSITGVNRKTVLNEGTPHVLNLVRSTLFGLTGHQEEDMAGTISFQAGVLSSAIIERHSADIPERRYGNTFLTGDQNRAVDGLVRFILDH